MQITLNGDRHEVAGPLTVTDLLARLDIDARSTARPSVRADEVEIVNFVGGG